MILTRKRRETFTRGDVHEFDELTDLGRVYYALRAELRSRLRPKRKFNRPIFRTPRTDTASEPEFGNIVTRPIALTRLAQLKIGYTVEPQRVVVHAKKGDKPPAAPIESMTKRISDQLRQRRMREDVIQIWLHTPHKAFGMQVPAALIADGRGEEILRLLDDAYHRGS